MSTRRQEKLSQVVKQAVSRAIQQDLNDPRIEGIVSVTVVQMAADLRSAEVYLSVLGRSPGAENATYAALQGARRRIQGVVAKAVKSKFCPVIQLHKDEKFKKTLETMNLIDLAASEYRHDDLPDEEDMDQASESVDPPTEGDL